MVYKMHPPNTTENSEKMCALYTEDYNICIMFDQGMP